jgi:hypothetical protein
MIRVSHALVVAVTALVVGAAAALPAWAVTFTSSYTDGGTWRTLFAQGFKPSVNPSPNPGLAIADVVHLDRFQFFKSGATEYDTGGGVMAPIPPALDVQLAIVNSIETGNGANGIFVNLQTLTTTSPYLIGLSTNTIADVSTIATGDPITFNFDHLELVYGEDSSEELINNNYGAILVKKNPDNTLSPVRVPAIVVDYLDGQNEIESDYGQPGNYFLSGSNFMHTNDFGTYLDAFNATATNRHGDGNFVAYFDLPPGVIGDYNSDSVVNAADYTVWRNNLGGVSLPNEDATASPGTVDAADYTVWKTNFGLSGAGGGAVGGNAVPEPAAAWLALLAIVPLALCARQGQLRPEYWRA